MAKAEAWNLRHRTQWHLRGGVDAAVCTANEKAPHWHLTRRSLSGFSSSGLTSVGRSERKVDG